MAEENNHFTIIEQELLQASNRANGDGTSQLQVHKKKQTANYSEKINLVLHLQLRMDIFSHLESTKIFYFIILL